VPSTVFKCRSSAYSSVFTALRQPDLQIQIEIEMSLGDILNKYPVAAGDLQIAMAMLSKATIALNDHSVTVRLTAETAIGAVVLLPMLDTADPDAALPPIHVLLAPPIDSLWLKMISKSEKAANKWDTVFDIVGGATAAGDKLGADQTGITFKDVEHLLVPQTFLLDQAKVLGLCTIAPTPAATSGTNSHSVLTLSKSCGVDLDGGEWECSDKKNAQMSTFKLMALTRLWTREKMLHYAHNIVLDYVRLYDTCMHLRTSGKQHADTHMDAGLHMFSALHGLAVMRTAPSKEPAASFSSDSKFQHALLLHFNALDHTQISLLDFLPPDQANAAQFERGRCTPAARGILRSALEAFDTFFETFSHSSFNGALEVLTKSLHKDTHLWNRFDNAVLLFQLSSMVQAWGDDVRMHKRSDLDDKIDLSTQLGCSTLLRRYAGRVPEDAAGNTGGFADNNGAAHHFYARDHGLFWEIKQRPKTSEQPAGKGTKHPSEHLDDLDDETGEIPENKSAAAKSAAAKSAAQKTADAAAKTKATRAKQNCAYHMMQQLQLETKCTAGSKCEFKHQDLSAITKSQAVGCSKVPLPDKGLSEAFKKAVEAKTDWKIYEPPAPSPGKKVRFQTTT
jgi:hypothetical protein